MSKFTHLTLLFVLSCGFSAVSAHPPRYVPSPLEDAITVAVSERNQHIRTIIPDSCGIDARTWSREVRSAVRERSSPRFAQESVWSCFLYGLMLHLQKNGTGEASFIRALDYAEGNPAQTWLLFVEFNRYRLAALEDTSLDRIEKTLYQNGAVASSLIASHLVRFGIERKKQGLRDEALTFFRRAHRFNRFETASTRETFLMGMPFDFPLMSDAAGIFLATLSTSWEAQTGFVSTIFGGAVSAGAFFVVALTVLFGLKYFPRSLHRLVHLYPAVFSLKIRTWFVSAIFFSVLFLGFYPFFWMTAFLVRPHFNKKELMLGIAVMLLVTVSPGLLFVKQHLDCSRIPEYPLTRFSKSVYELPNSVNHQQLSPTVPELLARAIRALKHGSPQTAVRVFSQIPSSSMDDPVVVNTLGILHFFSGEIDSAAVCFRKILTTDPKNVYAYFNLSRCAMATNNASEGMEYLKNAAAIENVLVNSFIQKNDLLFDNNWPPLRQVMFADYSPLYFWKHFFVLSALPRGSFDDYWGVSFLGFSPGVSILIFIIISILLAVTGSRTLREKKVKRYLECKYCGQIICRHCTAGILCPACASIGRQEDGTVSLDQLRKNRMEITRTAKLLQKSLGNMFLPGAGSLLYDSEPSGASVILFMGTSICMTLWSSLFSDVPLSVLGVPDLIVLALPMSIFQIRVLLQNLPAAIGQGKSIISIYTSSGVR